MMENITPLKSLARVSNYFNGVKIWRLLCNSSLLITIVKFLNRLSVCTLARGTLKIVQNRTKSHKKNYVMRLGGHFVF